MSSTLDSNIRQYVDIMSRRASGELPEMGSAKRFAEIIKDTCCKDNLPLNILDVGCATGHYLRSFISRDIDVIQYTGIDIDMHMLDAARTVWSKQSFESCSTTFIEADIQELTSVQIPPHDVSICSNAFMYFKSPYMALRNILSLTSRFVLIRSYFMPTSYRIIRSQTSEIHDKSVVAESNSITHEGNFVSYDYWSIYSFSYIESLVKKLAPSARLQWLDDNNDFYSIGLEEKEGVSKRGATKI